MERRIDWEDKGDELTALSGKIRITKPIEGECCLYISIGLFSIVEHFDDIEVATGIAENFINDFCTAFKLDAKWKYVEARARIEGIHTYSWMKDGVTYVGTCGQTYERAIEKHEDRMNEALKELGQ